MSDVLGIGTDITECLRIAKMIERHADLFINRVYTARETRYCQSRKQSTEHFTGRWAAKEAVLKALGTGWRRGITWRDVEILNEVGGRPVVYVHGGAKKIVEQMGITSIQISISHCHTHAIAMAVATGPNKD